MRKYKLIFILAICSLALLAQSQTVSRNVEIGDIFEIGKPDSTTDTYRHIDFPRPNIIIKRGGIADYKRLKGYKVEVAAVNTKKDGTTSITIKRKDGGRFFGSHTSVEAAFHAALQSGELSVIND